MAELIEGRNAVLEALRAGVPLERVEVANGVKPDALVREVLSRARGAGVTVTQVDRAALDRVSPRGRHQGMVAYLPAFSYTDLRDVLARTAGADRGFVLVLDHVTDPGNFGAIVRSAEGAGADGVIIAERRSAPVTAVVHKAAAGATWHMPIVRVPNLVRALGDLKEHGYWVIGASEHAKQTLWEAPLEGKVALVLGAEGSGISRLVQSACDLMVTIPLTGKVGSLNVAQAATVLLFEWRRREESS
ncbi:MAG: 23S rRNA (guanosine(2251)-2'-O)-methyltransferase RlmB [Actinomycetia bacterium]|nr:23S rRNA (guanosine(2251)-2'-O)-methyltransferase RlmB [Actinomycetes bacterium]